MNQIDPRHLRILDDTRRLLQEPPRRPAMRPAPTRPRAPRALLDACARAMNGVPSFRARYSSPEKMAEAHLRLNPHLGVPA